MKKNFIFIFYLISGIIIGSLIAAVTQNVGWLSWLGYGIDIGISPFTLDLAILSLTFGFTFALTIAHIITIGAALALYGARRGK